MPSYGAFSIRILLTVLVVHSIQAADPVKLAVYYESLCPGCQDFISSHVWPTYLELSEIMRLHLIPFGNANFSGIEYAWKFQCQHGPRECFGNKIQSCVLNYYDMKHALPFIGCVMATPDPVHASRGCAIDHGISWRDMKICLNTYMGDSLLHDNGVLTKAFQPPVTYVPWIVINDVYSPAEAEMARKNLLHVICKAFKGDLPPACNRV